MIILPGDEFWMEAEEHLGEQLPNLSASSTLTCASKLVDNLTLMTCFRESDHINLSRIMPFRCYSVQMT